MSSPETSPETTSYRQTSGTRPSYGWDYALVFPATSNPLATPIPADAVRIQVLSKLRSASFSFSQLWVPAESRVLVLLALPQSIMQQKAHLDGLHLRLKSSYGAGFLAFDPDRAHVFVNDDRVAQGLPYFTPAQRVKVTLNVLRSREGWGAALNFNTLKRHGYLKKAFALHASPEKHELVQDVVYRRWWHPTPSLPLARLRHYFGTRVTLYLAWLSFYARMLVGIAALSIPVFLLMRVSQSERVEACMRLCWGLAVCFWGTYWFEYWKRRNAVLNVQWGLTNFYEDSENDLRAEFRGEDKPGFYSRGGFVNLDDLGMNSTGEGVRRRWVQEGEFGAATSGDADVVHIGGKSDPDFMLEAPVTGLHFADLPQFPYSSRAEWRRRMWITSFITLVFSIVVAVLSVAILFYKKHITQVFGAEGFGPSVPGIATALLISLSDSMWKPVSSHLTEWENHRTAQSHENSLISKRFAFQFVSNYVSLFYVALVKPFTPTDACMANPNTGEPDCMTELTSLLTSLVITKATVQQIMELGVPFVTFRVKRWFQRRTQAQLDADLSNSERTFLLAAGATFDDPVSQKSLEESKMEPYHSTMEDYAEMVIQHGFLTLFGLAFPLAAVINLINNMVETRTDTYKLLAVQQRPNSEDAADIGRWQDILQFLSLASVVMTAAMVTITTPALQRALPDSIGDVAERYPAVSFLFFEHVLLFVRWAVGFLVSDVPSSTYRMLARQQFLVARCFDVGWKSYYRSNDNHDDKA